MSKIKSGSPPDTTDQEPSPPTILPLLRFRQLALPSVVAMSSLCPIGWIFDTWKTRWNKHVNLIHSVLPNEQIIRKGISHEKKVVSKISVWRSFRFVFLGGLLPYEKRICWKVTWCIFLYLIKVKWTPSDRWTAEQSIHRNTP